jgi:trigger factor
MKSNVETLEGNKVKLTVELEDAELERAIEAAFKKIANQVNIPGFRRGKAPRKLIEAQIGADAARAQALNDSLPDHYIQALRDNDVDAIAPPKLEITSGEENGPVVFEAEVEIRPVPDLDGYQKLSVTIPNPVPSDEDVDAQIERMRTQNGELADVDRPATKGDFVTLDIEGMHEGEPVAGLTASDWMYEVGTALQSLGEDFDGQIDGAKAGDVKTFSSPVPPNDEVVDFTVTIKQVQERKLPELTDEWANEVSEFDTVAELRDDISSRLKQVRRVEAGRALRTAAIEAVAQLVDEDVPEALIDDEMRRQLQDFDFRLRQQGAGLAQFLAATGQDQNAFVESLRSNAVESVRADLALRSVAEKEALTATDEEVDSEISMIAEQFGQKVAKVRRELERNDQIPAVRSDIRKAKAVDWLVEHVEIVDADGKAIDRADLDYKSSDDHEGHSHGDED